MKDLRYILLLLAAVSVHLFVSGILFEKSVLPKVHDERIRIVNFIRFDSLFFDKRVDLGNKIKAVLSLDQWSQGHPHFYETAGAFSWRIVSSFYANREHDILKLLAMVNVAVMLTNSLFLLVMVFSVYGIGALCFSRGTGFLAALLTLFFPLVFGHSRVALLDYPLLCMSSLSMFLLLKTEGFKSGFFAALYGISFVLAQLTKETAFLFLGGPSIYYFTRSITRGKDIRKITRNIILSVVLCALGGIAAFLLFVNNNVALLYMKKLFSLKAYIGDLSFIGVWSINSIGWVLSIALLPFLASYFFHIKKRNKLFLIWFFVPAVIFSLKVDLLSRYLLPVLPALALAVAGELHELRIRPWVKKAYALFLIAAAVVQYSLINYGMVGLVGVPGNTCYTLERGMLTVFKDTLQPTAQEMFAVFQREPVNRSGVVTILFLFNIAEIQGNLSMYLDSSKMPFYVACYMQDDEAKAQHYDFDYARWQDVVLHSAYVVDKQGWQGEYGNSRAQRIQEMLKKIVATHKNKFYLLARIAAPDKSTISIYKRKK